MKKSKFIIAAAVAAVVVAAIFTALILTAGGSVDVIKTYSEKSLSKVYETCETEGYIQGDAQNYTLSVDGKAEFFRGNGTVGINVDLTPFVAAGLDISLLPENYNAVGGVLSLTVKESRGILGYHSAMGHFNFALGGGAFEWAQDMSANDMDIVFALVPEPFTEAGVDPEKVEGWSYSLVEMHSEGKTVKEYRFIKSFNLA